MRWATLVRVASECFKTQLATWGSLKREQREYGVYEGVLRVQENFKKGNFEKKTTMQMQLSDATT